ncbi:MAG: response regulator transcription factor [Terracidiphilus sp.]|nr:response regulator transcription factor [Terracidiphilus sp.]
MAPISILIVDDHPVVLLGVGALIAASKNMELVAQARNGEEAVRLHQLHHPDITLMDLRLPGINGVEAIRQIRNRDPRARFIVLTTYEGDEDIYQALEAGASGYLIKDMPQEVLFEAIRKVHMGGRYLPSPVSQALASRMPDSSLSKRECDVLGLMAQGRSNGEIAGALGITEGTVKCHVSVILNRLNVRDRTQAVVIALQRGLIHL